jgi:hypothetical protein
MWIIEEITFIDESKGIANLSIGRVVNKMNRNLSLRISREE